MWLQNNLGTALFEDIACMIYDLIDAKRQYQTYLDNLKLLHVPVPGETAQTQGKGPQMSIKNRATLFHIFNIINPFT